MSFLKRGKTWLFLHTLQTQLDLAEAQQPEHIIKVELLFHLSSFLQVNVNLFYPTNHSSQARWSCSCGAYKLYFCDRAD